VSDAGGVRTGRRPRALRPAVGGRTQVGRRRPARRQPADPPGAAPGPAPTPGRGDRDATAAVLGALATAALWALRALVLVVAAAALWWAAGQLWTIVLPILLALLLTSVLWPPTRVLRRFLPPALAALVVVTSALLVLAGLVAFLVPRVIDQAQPLTDQFVVGLEELQALLVRVGPAGPDQFGSALDALIEQVQSNAQVIAFEVLYGLTVVGSAVVTALLAVVLTFFFLKDGPRFLPWACGLLRPRAGTHLRVLAERCWTTLGGFIRTQAAVGLVDAVFIGLGLVVLGVPLPLTLAVLIFFAAFVPIVGAVATGALAAVVALVDQGLTTALLVAGLVLLVQQLESNVLQPVLVGRVLALHPVVILLAVTAGVAVGGIIGAFLAVPVVAAVAVVLRYIGEVASAAPEPDGARPTAAP